MSGIVILEAIMQLSMVSMIGLYFIFSNTIMAALRNTRNGADVMTEINDVILNPFFYLLFFGSALSSVYLLVMRDQTEWLAGLVFFVGTFVVTLARNVPLNNQLKSALGQQTQQAEVWQQYLQKWLFWNHLRTLSSFVSGALLFV